MLLHASGYGEDIRVEDDVERVHAHLFGEYVVCALCYLLASLERSGLTLFVETHHHDGSAISHHVACMANKHLFSFFERYGVDDTFSLYAFQSFGNHIPVRRVDHHRHSCHVRFGGYEIEKGLHLLLGVEQSVVHIDVDDLCTISHLFSCNAYGFLIVFLFNQSQELPGTSHITAFADIDKSKLGCHVEHVES